MIKKIWIKDIRIYNINDKKKKIVILNESQQLVKSLDNNTGKTLLVMAIPYVLGNDKEPFNQIIEKNTNNFQENLEKLVIAVTFNINDNSFTFVRKSYRSEKQENKKIFVIKNNELNKIYEKYSKSTFITANNLTELAKNAYEIMDIADIPALYKSHNNFEIKIPLLTTLLGFFIVNQINQNDEFYLYSDNEISKFNKFNIDGRLLSYMFLTNDIKNEESKMMLTNIQNVNKSDELKQELKKIQQIILDLNNKQENYKISKRNIDEYSKNEEELYNDKKNLFELDKAVKRIEFKIINLRREREKINNKKDIMDEILNEFENREINFFDNETNKVKKIYFNEIFPKTLNLDFITSISNLEEQIQILKGQRTKINIQKKEKIKEVEVREKKLKDILNKNENISPAKMFNNTIEELAIFYEIQENEIKTKLSKIKKTNKMINANIKNKLWDIEQFNVYKHLQVKKLINLMYSLESRLKEEPHISFPDFPININSLVANTGSSANPYALTKILHYMTNIIKINNFVVIDYEGSDDAGELLNNYTKKVMSAIIEKAKELDKQLIIFKNEKKNTSLQETINSLILPENVYILDNKVSGLISDPLEPRDILFLSKILSIR